MNIPPEASARGGSVTAKQSRAKARALKLLHERRKGKRINDPGLSDRELHSLLGHVVTLINRHKERGRISFRQAAMACKVDVRTLHRWLNGKHIPPAHSVKRLSAWVRSVEIP